MTLNNRILGIAALALALFLLYWILQSFPRWDSKHPQLVFPGSLAAGNA